MYVAYNMISLTLELLSQVRSDEVLTDLLLVQMLELCQVQFLFLGETRSLPRVVGRLWLCWEEGGMIVWLRGFILGILDFIKWIQERFTAHAWKRRAKVLVDVVRCLDK